MSLQFLGPLSHPDDREVTKCEICGRHNANKKTDPKELSEDERVTRLAGCFCLGCNQYDLMG